MPNSEIRPPAFLLSPSDWVGRVAQQTGAFTVVEDYEDGTVSISIPPTGNRIDLHTAFRQNVSARAVLEFGANRRRSGTTDVQVICTPYISERAAELCRNENIGYIDRVGNCRISAPGLLVHVSGMPNRPDADRSQIDVFSHKSSRIVRALLSEPTRGWQVQQLAAGAGVSLGLASRVKSALIEDAYLEERDKRVYLRDAVRLLQDWAAHDRPPVVPMMLFSLLRPTEIERELVGWCRDNGFACAVTLLSAAWQYSPVVRFNSLVAYVDERAVVGPNRAGLLRRIDAREVDSGANCTLWPTHDRAVFTDSREIEGVPVVSPLQLYLDLKTLPGRGGEAADEILRTQLAHLTTFDGAKSISESGNE